MTTMTTNVDGTTITTKNQERRRISMGDIFFDCFFFEERIEKKKE